MSLKAGIQRVFHKIGCKDQTGLLGNAGVTENNMMQYLGTTPSTTLHYFHQHSATQHNTMSRDVRSSTRELVQTRINSHYCLNALENLFDYVHTLIYAPSFMYACQIAFILCGSCKIALILAVQRRLLIS